jgi:flagellar basal-body rod protein FlgG
MLSNNLANTNTPGYKKDSEFYGLYRSQVMNEDPDGADPVTPSLPFIERPWTDFKQGTIERTGNSSDLALSGDGFFAVQGPSGVIYTRNGHFRMSTDGQLQTSDGYPLLGEDGNPVQVTPGQEFQIETDGTVKQGAQTVGKLQLAAFKDTSAMVKRGYSYFATGETPSAAADCSVLQGASENSNVPVAESAIRLVGLTRQFEMLNKAVSVCGQMGQQAVQELGKVTG